MDKERFFVKVEGIVQGVGFRPFVYNLAVKLGIKGWVNNNSEGVYIDIECSREILNELLKELKNNPPPLSRIENITVTEKQLMNYDKFFIKASEEKEEKITLVSPDMSICSQCRDDIFDKNNRRYRYPFTNCTNCGPRFTIIKSIPYDRIKTTMSKFPMCGDCTNEYTDPTNRRFHAQPNACDKCGPHVSVIDNTGKELNSEDPIAWSVDILKTTDAIFAVKGIGGYNLVCDAHNDNAVKSLRERKKRPYKPFAVMMSNIETVKKYCYVNGCEEKLLTGIRKPIVLLRRRPEYNLPESIAPGQVTLGVMLPYTPLHELLFVNGSDTLIMTSANISGLPLEYINNSAFEHLKDIVDYFLMHNRDIYIPIDDSVTKVVRNEERIIRRARGYVPEPIKSKGINNILACGSNMKNTFAIGKEDFIFISQHNGDLENLETYEHYKRNIEHFKSIFSFEPKYIAYDLHPEYMSTEYAASYNLPEIGIQHHHAHIVSCMAENNIKEKVIGIAFDGTGFGLDEKIWGGEFLLSDLKNFRRLAHLDYVKMPGGDAAVSEPYRMAISYIYKAFKEGADFKNLPDMHQLVNKLFGTDGLNILKLLERNMNFPETSSMGRLFDAVSSLAGVRDRITYEGQASIELEALIDKKYHGTYSYDIINDDCISIDLSRAIVEIITDRFNNVSTGTISSKFHYTVISFTKDILEILRNRTGIDKIALSGGVFQNTFLLENLIDTLEKDNFFVYSHKNIPTNDGGVSLGQIIAADEIINSGIESNASIYGNL